jgi:plasmid maintenance system killer protein
MRVNPLRKDLQKYLARHNLGNKFTKQLNLLLIDSAYPSLNTERIGTKHLEIYSFRIDRKYRAIFFYTQDGAIEIVDINNHYK